MVRINVVLAAVVCAAVALQAVRGVRAQPVCFRQDGGPCQVINQFRFQQDDACYAELSGLQAAQAACKQQATELQQQLETLKVDRSQDT